MDRNPTPLTDGTAPPDDAELGALVRAVADDWHRPPQRLGQPTWRERVDVTWRGSRSSGGRRWFGKVAEAGVLAVVATLVLAVSAIFLVGNGRNGGVGTVPSSQPTEGIPGAVVASCQPMVTDAVLPAWARAGFSDPEPKARHVIGESGAIAAILFGPALFSPPDTEVSNKILWVSKEPAGETSLVISAQRMDGSAKVGDPVERQVDGGPGPSTIDLPEAGCWRLTLSWSGRTDQLDLAYQGPAGADPSPTPLPSLLVNGELPSVTTVLMAGNGYRLVDLSTGTAMATLPWERGGWNSPLPRPGGGWVCVCGTYTGTGSAATSRLAISLDAVDADGLPAGRIDLRTLQSGIDPAQPATSDSFTVDARAVASADGRYAFVGWSERTATGWHAGVDVVDLVTLVVVDGLDLPDVDRSAVALGRSWARSAPVVDTAPGTDAALITGDWFVEEPTAIAPSGADHWTTTFEGGKFGRLRGAGTRVASDCYEWERGVVDPSTYYVACISSNGGAVRIERYDAAGGSIDAADVGSFTGFGAFAARPDHRLFLWDPQQQSLTAYDLQTGITTSAKAPDTASTGPLEAIGALGRAIGDWLVPTATAKILLEPALAISPDGTTLYALGISGSFESMGSAGIYAFDIGGDTPAFKSHWEPTADFISLAVSEDGAFVYASGMSGVDAAGVQAPYVQASVTVFDATNGAIRLIAGQLGAEAAPVFLEPIVR